MDPVDPGMIEELISAIGNGSVAAIVGLALLILAPAVLYVTAGKLSPLASKWVSLIRGLAVGLGSGLVAATASGGEWWVGLVTGGVGLLASQGFLDVIRSLVPDRGGVS